MTQLPPKTSAGHKTRGELAMPQRLGELLIAEDQITADQLADAVEAQCLYGGCLGTCLIELGYLSEEVVAQTLSHKLQRPYIEPGLMMKIPPEVIALVSQKLACKYRVVPCKLEKKRLYLAMLDPTNLTIIDDLAFQLGFIIVPVVVTELRLMLTLQKYYRLELSPRFHSISQKLAARKRMKNSPSPITDAPSTGSLAQPDDEPILELAEADILPAQNDTQLESGTLQGLDKGLNPLSDEEYQRLIEPPTSPTSPPAQPSFASLCKRLVNTKNRDEIADALIDYLASICDAVALLMIKEGEAMGWKAYSSGKIIDNFDQLHIPLDQPSLLQRMASTKIPYQGALPQEVNNLLLSSRFGHQIPESVLLLPLQLRGRLVTILYLQNVDKMSQEQIATCHKIIGRAAMAFEMLILKNKVRMG